ncbi:Uncharacterized protein OS=Pedosphaera parvula (strain Ellin514) GN=Cflav_PD2062 PE=4 SV=1 [Gemmata massiliana]|uniref:Uncharacterized protein n=1 Tax=Gemmata massiliana TaxID=1210884 RepID=A0A6P2DHS2_9BACT|nr:TIGR03067 domain-containing protein [Gemmata massiliana]VTS02028.1 Uncharacterized protein OS=Pedosphaera parvula (strain Ellin514) GN=Cflav_PD2062 PE=4 SV=1 [Gemmata massiliana]
MKLRIVWAAALVACVVAPAPADEKNDKVKAAAAKAEAARIEAEKIEGIWTATAGTRDGQALTKDELAKLSLALVGPKAKQFIGNTTSLAAYLPEGSVNAANVNWSVTPGTSPREIDFARNYGARTSYYPGIYELKADELTLCVDFTPSPNGPPMRKRPTKFEAPKGSPYTLLTFKRTKQ